MKTLDKMMTTDELLSIEDVQLELTEALRRTDWTDLKSHIEDIQTCIGIAHHKDKFTTEFESVGTIDVDFCLHNINKMYYELISQSYDDSEQYEQAALLIMKDRVKSGIKLCEKMIESSIPSL